MSWDADSWRTALYPLGYLSALFFALRFVVQWWASERAGRSVVTKGFWLLSGTGNLLLALHGMVQLQLPVLLTQQLNGAIALRNLNLMAYAESHWSRSRFLAILIGSLLTTTALFYAQALFSPSTFELFRAPATRWNGFQEASPSFLWQLFGTAGLCLFNGRFWLQWWQAEADKASHLSLLFWQLSLFGSIAMLVYFWSTYDPVNAIGPLFGMVFYVRNLCLVQSQSAR